MSDTGRVGDHPAQALPTGHAWDRLDRMWLAIFHLALGGAAVVALAGSPGRPGRVAGLLAAVAVVAGARHLADRCLQGVEEGSRRHLGVGMAWAGTTLPALVALVHAEEAFFFAIYGLFPQAFRMLPRGWATGFSAALVPVVLLGAEGTSALQDSGFVVSVVGSALLAPAIGLFIHAISRQSEQRHETIVALEAAQDEAEALLAASLAISRARTPDDLAAAVRTCLAHHGIEAVRLVRGRDRVAECPEPSQPAPARRAGSPTVAARVPLGATEEVLTLEAWGPVPASSGSRRTLDTLATSCGLALENLRLVEQAREAGVLEERARLAREIHDTLAQGFVSVLTQLQAVGEQLAGPDEVVRRVEQASRIARDSLGEARRSVQDLRPEVLEVSSLRAALERVVARWSADSAVHARVAIIGSAIPLPPPIEVTLLRAAQEALANVARHAAANEVVLTLSYLGDEVVLDVHDDGRGFRPAALGARPRPSCEVEMDRSGRPGRGASGGSARHEEAVSALPGRAGPSAAAPLGPADGTAAMPRPAVDARPGGGFGLEGIRQRAGAAGGFVAVESEPGQGTTLTVHIPYPIPPGR